MKKAAVGRYPHLSRAARSSVWLCVVVWGSCKVMAVGTVGWKGIFHSPTYGWVLGAQGIIMSIRTLDTCWFRVVNTPRGSGTTPLWNGTMGKRLKRNLLLSSAYFKNNLTVMFPYWFTLITILSKYNHPPFDSCSVHNPKYFLVVTIMDGDFTEGGVKTWPCS